MSNIDWSRGTSTNSGRYYSLDDRVDAMRYAMEREMRHERIRMKSPLSELRTLKIKLDEIETEEPVTEENNEPIFFDPKELVL